MPTQVARDAERAATKARFLELYRDLGTIRETAAAVGISRRTHTRWVDADPDYARAFAAAQEDAADTLEREAIRRAVEGVDEPVFYKGDVVGHVRRYSDSLLMFMLKGLRPDKFRENGRFEVVTTDAIDAEIARLEQRLGQAAADERPGVARAASEAAPPD